MYRTPSSSLTLSTRTLERGTVSDMTTVVNRHRNMWFPYCARWLTVKTPVSHRCPRQVQRLSSFLTRLYKLCRDYTVTPCPTEAGQGDYGRGAPDYWCG